MSQRISDWQGFEFVLDGYVYQVMDGNILEEPTLWRCINLTGGEERFFTHWELMEIARDHGRMGWLYRAYEVFSYFAGFY